MAKDKGVEILGGSGSTKRIPPEISTSRGIEKPKQPTILDKTTTDPARDVSSADVRVRDRSGIEPHRQEPED